MKNTYKYLWILIIILVVTVLCKVTYTYNTAQAATQNNEFQNALNRWCNAGVTTKCTEAIFRANDSISRQEFSKFINAFVSASISAPTTTSASCLFSDANIFDSTLASHITMACERWYMKWSKWKFMPRDLLTRGQLITVIVRTFQGKLDETTSPWYQNYLRWAQANTLVTDMTNFNDNATRSEALVMLYRASKLPAPTVSTITNWIDYTHAYTINNTTYWTKTTVTLSNGKRTIITNSLPSHPTGIFPNQWNPNTIKAIDKTYSMTLTPVKNSSSIKWAQSQMPWVWIDGVFFEPQTAEKVTCTDWQSFSIEAIQPKVDLWLDDQNAHVQPDGSYHYHGIAPGLVSFADQWDDLVLVWFASDWHYMYYSKSWKYSPSYKLKSGMRSVSGTCTYRNKTRDVAGAYDGTFVTDREYDKTRGNLDECNGTTINGQYAYLVTDDYPYIGRCLYGNPDNSFLKAWPNWGAGWPPNPNANGGPWWFPPPR
jgi:hypothetical protein